MHHRTQITMETDTQYGSQITMETDRHYGSSQTTMETDIMDHRPPWKQTLWITDHHGNRHTIWVITDHHGNRHTSYGSSWNTYNHKNRRPPRTHYHHHETNVMDDNGTNRYINMEHCRSSPPRAYRATKGRWPYPPISCGSIST